jgi:hypothetical protein
MRAALEDDDLRWEGSAGKLDGPVGHHRALVGAVSEDDAIDTVRKALEGRGAFDDFRAEPVRDSRGEVKRTPIRGWEDVDWDHVQSQVSLSELQRTLLGTFLNAAEPTWMILSDPDVPDDRDEVEAALRDLERRGIVDSKVEESGETGREYAPDNWWALTDEGWDVLGLIKSPGYW